MAEAARRSRRLVTHGNVFGELRGQNVGPAVLLAATLQASETGQPFYEAEFAPLALSERQYAHLGPAGSCFQDRAFRNHQSGEGRLRCTSGVGGDLQGCVEVSERPSGSDFSAAARVLADRKRIQRTVALAPGESIIVRAPFVLRAPAAVMERAVRIKRSFKGSASGVTGHAEVACVVAAAGLDHCLVLYFQSGSRSDSATTSAAALAAVSQVSPGELGKGTWVIMPVDVRPTATSRP